MIDSKNCLIFEVYKGSKLFKLNENQENVPAGMMRVTGVAAVIGVQNRNGRIYNKENYLRHIELLQQSIVEGLYGELEHPEGFTINNNNISHKVESVWYDDSTSEVKITILLLDTEKGKIAQSIIRSGGSLRVSSRAMGSVNNAHEAIIEKLVTYDIVGTPGFKETSLHLSENLQLIGKDSLCESYAMFISQDNQNYQPIKTKAMTNKNLTLLEQELASRKSVNEQYVTKDFLKGSFANGMQKWLNEEYATVIQNWITESALPLFESYLKRKSINESLGKPACSFNSYFAMAVNETNRMNEAQSAQNGTIVLSEEEKQICQKCIDGEQLTQSEQKVYQQAQQKLQQQQQQLKEAQEPDNGELVLSEEEEQAVQKLQEGEQLDADELKQAQSGIQKLKQQDAQVSQGAQSIKQQEKQKQQLRESLYDYNITLNSAYYRLLESSDQDEQKQINQEIDEVQQKIDQTQKQLEGVEQGKMQQAQKLTQAEQSVMQKLAQGEQLSNQELKQAEQAQQKIQQNAKLQQQQQLKEGQQQAQKLTQAEQSVMQKLAQGEQLSNQELKQAEQAQQKIQQNAKLQQQQQLKEGQQQAQKLTQAEQSVMQKLAQGEQLSNQELKQAEQAQQKIQQNAKLQQQQLKEGQQSKAFQNCQQKLQQQETLTQEDIEDLTQSELQEIIDQQKQNEGASDFDDPKDAKVFQQEDDNKPLPSDSQVSESLIGKQASKVLSQSGSLLESIQKRLSNAMNDSSKN